ncbi:hypothetical protein L210DRAFT_3510620 [Boletus edulis BED1]|uniref:Uncharacterized protein n=1 Tax=Boletus edulis BED1 TaxID=1328754 RepID=A0AAD4BDA7_BOLED|nr:hypothetical protein L210DRAFT_3510620 [Boletus edulis BED1]
MEQHTLAILKQNDLCNWLDTKQIQALGKQGGKFQVVTPKLLYFLIVESQGFGGEVPDHFWKQLGTCDEKLKENIKSLKQENFVSAQKSFDVLFCGLHPTNVDFEPVLDMAVIGSGVLYSSWCCVGLTIVNAAVMSPRGRKSGTSTEFSISEVVNEETDKLLQQVNEEGDFGKQKQELFKALPFRKFGIYPALAHIIPNSVHRKPDTLKCIAMFAGATATDEVVHHLNNIGNVMNMQHNAHSSYDNLEWGIEAKEEGGEMSGAADIILEWKDHADDNGSYCLFIASKEFCDMLDAKLFLSGRAVVA